jgi:DNA-binding NarL/FixJ family response regulator
VLVLDNMPDDTLGAAVRAQVVSLLPRGTMDRDRFVTAVIAAAQDRARRAETALEALVGELDEVRATVHDHLMTVLDDRDVELLSLIADGRGTQEIAGKLSLSHRTVVNRMQAVIKKCGAQNRCEAVAQAVRAGLL